MLTTNKKSFFLFTIVLVSTCVIAQSRTNTKLALAKESIFKHVKSPELNTLEYDAKTNKTSDNKEAINKAILKSSKKVGGIVLILKRKYLLKAIHLESNVNLYLDKDSEVLFSTIQKTPLISSIRRSSLKWFYTNNKNLWPCAANKYYG